MKALAIAPPTGGAVKRNPFTTQADAEIGAAFSWLAQRAAEPREPLPAIPYKQGRPLTQEEQRLLRLMADQAVWQEIGGRAVREQSRYLTGGDVIGRTEWVGMPEWARGFGYDREEIRAIVEKAIRGERLASKQRLLIQVMMETIAECSAVDCPF